MFDGTPLPETPLPLFDQWLTEAEAHAGIRYARAMCLSTIMPDGFPDGRMVLLHAVDVDGFRFLTDRRSPKATALLATPRAALTLYWEPLERQVRVQGSVVPGTDAEADTFFGERPRRSRVTAWASMQSHPLPDRTALDHQVATWDAHFPDTEPILRPPHWQAYRVRPRRIEFWQARARRLHDRVAYEMDHEGHWSRTLLSP